MPIAEIVLFLVLGGLFGFAGGVFGIGGAVLAIPILGIFFGMPEALAQGTAIVMALPNVFVAVWRYHKRAGINFKIAGYATLVALPFTYVSAHIATSLPSRPLRIGFAIFLLLMAADLARRTFGSAITAQIRLPKALMAIVGAVSGICFGFFAMGGGVVTVPLMTTFFGFTQMEAQGMTLAIGLPNSLLTTVTYAAAHDVNWMYGIAMAVGGVCAVPAGVDLAHRLPERTLRLAYLVFIIVVAVSLLAKAA